MTLNVIVRAGGSGNPSFSMKIISTISYHTHIRIAIFYFILLANYIIIKPFSFLHLQCGLFLQRFIHRIRRKLTFHQLKYIYDIVAFLHSFLSYNDYHLATVRFHGVTVVPVCGGCDSLLQCLSAETLEQHSAPLLQMQLSGCSAPG